jgi:hypothetical protein
MPHAGGQALNRRVEIQGFPQAVDYLHLVTALPEASGDVSKPQGGRRIFAHGVRRGYRRGTNQNNLSAACFCAGHLQNGGSNAGLHPFKFLLSENTKGLWLIGRRFLKHKPVLSTHFRDRLSPNRLAREMWPMKLARPAAEGFVRRV